MEPKFNATNGMLCWNPGTDQVEVGPQPNDTKWGRKYKMSALACYPHVKQMNFEQRKTLVFIEAIHLIVRDRCDTDSVMLSTNSHNTEGPGVKRSGPFCRFTWRDRCNSDF